MSGSTRNVAALYLDVNMLRQRRMSMMDCFLCAWTCTGLMQERSRTLDPRPQLSVG